MSKLQRDGEKTVQQLVAELQELRAQVQAHAAQTQWHSVPVFPELEVSEDGRGVRLVRSVQPQRSGVYAVQVNGRSIRATLETLYKAAWPEKWPALAREAELRVAEPPSDPGPHESPTKLTAEQARALVRRIG
jgi:hypothetical protein